MMDDCNDVPLIEEGCLKKVAWADAESVAVIAVEKLHEDSFKKYLQRTLTIEAMRIKVTFQFRRDFEHDP